MIKRIKLKLADRISVTFVVFFLIIMFFCGFFVVNFFNFQNKNNNKISYEKKMVEINDFLNKVSSFSEKYNTITLEFNPKIENQSVVYSKPFEPGIEKYEYIIRIRNAKNYDEIALNTFTSKNTGKVNDIKKDISEVNKLIGKNKINKNHPIHYKKNGHIYDVIRISRNIGGNVFDVYIVKDVTGDITIIKTLILLFLLYTLLSLAIIVFMTNILTSKILKPVNSIIKTASSISTNDLTVRINNTNTGDELDTLINIINNMLERLNIAFDNQSKFISDVSHELRTPLAIIKGYAELMKRHGSSTNDLINESVDLIINESMNMKNLVDKLLFLAKGDANTVKINIETFDSVGFINQVYTDALFFAKDHEIVIDRNEKYTILADRSLLLQAIRTMIENSVKYSPKGSSIYVNSSYDQEKKEAVISIKDEGIGIDKKYFDKIFERFYRVDESRTKDTGGTGLGLSIVKKIISIHSGSVEVKSEINKGSEFILHIPSKIHKEKS